MQSDKSQDDNLIVQHLLQFTEKIWIGWWGWLSYRRQSTRLTTEHAFPVYLNKLLSVTKGKEIFFFFFPNFHLQWNMSVFTGWAHPRMGVSETSRDTVCWHYSIRSCGRECLWTSFSPAWPWTPASWMVSLQVRHDSSIGNGDHNRFTKVLHTKRK